MCPLQESSGCHLTHLLMITGFEKIVLDKLTDDMSHKPRAGKEWIGRWRKRAASL